MMFESLGGTLLAGTLVASLRGSFPDGKVIVVASRGNCSRFRITRQFWPHCLPLVWSSLLVVVLDRVAHAEMARARLVLQLMFSPCHWLSDLPDART